MELNAVNKCTYCEKPLDDIKIIIKMETIPVRKTKADTWENIDNVSVRSNEIICPDCFDIFSNALSNLFKKEK